MSYGEGGYGEDEYGTSTDGGEPMTQVATVNLTAKEEGNVEVTVTTDGGNALSGMSIELSGPSSYSGQTDDNGQVTLGPLEVAEYELLGTMDGYLDINHTITVDSFDPV